MRGLKIFLSACLVSLLLAASAFAGEVRVFMPKEEEMSPMEMRSKAMAEGFALAVLEEARPMLPGTLDEVRSELFKEYLLTHAKPYVQGYKIISSEEMAEGLILVLDVRVNKRTLRDGLKRMGFAETLAAPMEATVVWPEDMTEEALVQLQGLMTLTGIQVVPDVLPAFTLEFGPEGTYKGRLEVDDRELVAMNKDMATVWFDLWTKYFTRSDVAQQQVGLHRLSVSGWFSPDAALEFDRVLKTWDSTMQDVSLLELDMQPTGVGGTWKLRLLDAERLDMLLKSYLPQRGLSYQLSEEPTP